MCTCLGAAHIKYVLKSEDNFYPFAIKTSKRAAKENSRLALF